MVTKGDTRSLDYSSNGACGVKVWGLGLMVGCESKESAFKGPSIKGTS